MKNLILSTAVIGLAACSGSATSPASNSGVLDGTIKGASNLTVSVPGSSLTSNTDARGNFAFVNVPAGTDALHLSGSGVNATLAISALIRGEDRHMSVSVSGNSAHEENELESDRFEGAISAIVAPNLTVGGKTVTTTGATQFLQHGAAVTIDALAIGDVVEVEGAPQADGSVVARKVRLEGADDAAEREADDEDQHVTGAVTAVDAVGGSLTIGTTTVLVTASTRLDDIASLSAVSVGDLLDVEATAAADGTLTATEIRAARAPQPPLMVEVRGPISAVDAVAGTVTVDGKAFTVTAATRLDHDGLAFTLASLKVGQNVDIRGAVQASGDLVASRIQLRD